MWGGSSFLTGVCLLSHFSLCPSLWNSVALQAPLSKGFSRQEHWSGLPFPSLGDIPDPGIKPASLYVSCIVRQIFLPLELPGNSSHRTNEFLDTRGTPCPLQTSPGVFPVSLGVHQLSKLSSFGVSWRLLYMWIAKPFTLTHSSLLPRVWGRGVRHVTCGFQPSNYTIGSTATQDPSLRAFQKSPH